MSQQSVVNALHLIAVLVALSLVDLARAEGSFSGAEFAVERAVSHHSDGC
jgi:hypothetical protein